MQLLATYFENAIIITNIDNTNIIIIAIITTVLLLLFL